MSDRMVMQLSIADLLTSFATNAGNHVKSHERLCQLQAWAIQVFSLASLFWTSAIALSLLGTFRRWNVLKWELHLTTAIWLFSLSFGVAIWALHGYGDVTIWCWVKDTRLWWPCFYMFVVVAWINNLICYRLTHSCIHTTLAQISDGQPQFLEMTRRHGLRKMRNYILVFIFTWSIPLIHRFAAMLDFEPNWLRALHVALFPVQGFLNALVYGEVWFKLQDLLCRKNYQDAMRMRSYGALQGAPAQP
eukprot:c14795_g1_i1.p1 GENE.c14795_g1_i1~~c14795_g1_i1.p1  ORF type:complete len:247 (-),score=16.95 c14795_g1_i1:70-810(-)